MLACKARSLLVLKNFVDKLLANYSWSEFFNTVTELNRKISKRLSAFHAWSLPRLMRQPQFNSRTCIQNVLCMPADGLSTSPPLRVRASVRPDVRVCVCVRVCWCAYTGDVLPKGHEWGKRRSTRMGSDVMYTIRTHECRWTLGITGTRPIKTVRWSSPQLRVFHWQRTLSGDTRFQFCLRCSVH
jgi:hypothetical protein